MAEEVTAVDSGDSGDSGGIVGSAGGVAEGAGGTDEKGQPVFNDGKPYTWTANDGEVLDLSTRSRMTDHLRHSGMRRKDLDTAMDGVAKRSTALDAREQALKSQETVANNAIGQWGPVDQLMKTDPTFAKYVEDAYAARTKGRSGTPTDVREAVREAMAESQKATDERFSGLEKTRDEGVAKATTQNVDRRLREDEGEFDQAMLDAEFQKFQSMPRQDLEYAFRRLLLQSVRGRDTPAELERRAAENAGKRRAPAVTSTPGVKPAEFDPNTATEDQRREAALDVLDGMRRKG